MITVLILMGLPASGKSTFAEKCANENFGRVIDVDDIMNSYSEADANAIIVRSIKHHESNAYWIVDGLYLDNKSVGHLIQSISREVPVRIKFEIHYWNLDRETCLYNDTNRRGINSIKTITDAEYEYPDVTILRHYCNQNLINIFAHTIIRKPDYIMFSHEHQLKLSEMKYMYSEPWDSLDNTPLSFGEFDKLITDINPEITLKDYRDLYNKCVTIQNYINNSSTIIYTGFRYQCDIKTLYYMLLDMGFIEEYHK